MIYPFLFYFVFFRVKDFKKGRHYKLLRTMRKLMMDEDMKINDESENKLDNYNDDTDDMSEDARFENRPPQGNEKQQFLPCVLRIILNGISRLLRQAT